HRSAHSLRPHQGPHHLPRPLTRGTPGRRCRTAADAKAGRPDGVPCSWAAANAQETEVRGGTAGNACRTAKDAKERECDQGTVATAPVSRSPTLRARRSDLVVPA